MKLLALVSAALLAAVSGCAVVYPAPPVNAAQLLNEDPTAACLVSVGRDTRLALLEPKVGSLRASGEASVAMLSSKETPTPDEKKALELWGNERQRCLGLGTAYRTVSLPAAVTSTFEIGQRDLIVLTARLFAGELTYGQFNVQRQELATSHRQKYVEFEQQMASGQAGGGGSRMSSGNVRMPTQTNCNRYADIAWNCTTQ